MLRRGLPRTTPPCASAPVQARRGGYCPSRRAVRALGAFLCAIPRGTTVAIHPPATSGIHEGLTCEQARNEKNKNGRPLPGGRWSIRCEPEARLHTCAL